MKVTTNLTRKDFIKVNFILVPKRRSNYFAVLIVLSVLLFERIPSVMACPYTVSMLISEGVIALLQSILFMFVMSLLGSIMVVVMSNKSGIFSQNEITISEQGISSKTKLSEATIKWQLVKSIQSVKSSYLVINLSTGNFIIPKRDFDSEQTFEEFTKQATLYWNNANGELKEDK